MERIEDLLHRRSDLSTFLVHLTRPGTAGTPLDNLCNMIATRTLQARSPLGPAAARLRDLPAPGALASQMVVCLTETPLEHAWMMTRQIEGRQVQFAPYGLVFTKVMARKLGCNPVWYTDITPSGHEWLSNHINALIDEAVARHAPPVEAAGAAQDRSIDDEGLAKEHILQLTPFFEQMGPKLDGGHKEFWWEREWRKAGDFNFSPEDVVAVLAPEAEHPAIATALQAIRLSEDWLDRPVLDPSWGLERMIVAMARVYAGDIGPFTS